MSGKYVVLRDVPQRVQHRQPFRMSRSLEGGGVRSGTGWLPPQWAALFSAAWGADDFYAVHSYATPIAWHAHGLWVVPDVKYSRTTTRHQNIVRRGLDPAVCQVVGV